MSTRQKVLILIFYVISIYFLSNTSVIGKENNKYILKNGFYFLEIKDGIIKILKVDPLGKENYGKNVLISGFGLPQLKRLKPFKNVTYEFNDKKLRIENIKFSLISDYSYDFIQWPIELSTSTLGQIFLVKSPGLYKIGAKITNYGNVDSLVKLTLRKDGPEGNIIISKDIYVEGDNCWYDLNFPIQQEGVYYLEMEKLEGRVGWFTGVKNWSEHEEAYCDKKRCNLDRIFRYSTNKQVNGIWSIELNNNILHCEFNCEQDENKHIKNELVYYFIAPWIKNGYDTSEKDKILFKRFVAENDQYLPIEQFKRRPYQDQLRPTEWLECVGNNNYNLRFEFGKEKGYISWIMDKKQMNFIIYSNKFDLKILPQRNLVPSHYPIFFSSDLQVDILLNEFYYGHGFNFPASDAPHPEWREWLGLEFCWTNTKFRDIRRDTSTITVDKDGYVHTWYKNKGWTFPNPTDYDTRHFNTNAMLILGLYRYFVWTGDFEFLNSNIEMLRKVMQYQLENLHGKDGLLIIDSPYHTGKDKSLSSNYWDILPFGYKSGYENIYFYYSLKVIAYFNA